MALSEVLHKMNRSKKTKKHNAGVSALTNRARITFKRSDIALPHSHSNAHQQQYWLITPVLGLLV